MLFDIRYCLADWLSNCAVFLEQTFVQGPWPSRRGPDVRGRTASYFATLAALAFTLVHPSLTHNKTILSSQLCTHFIIPHFV